MNGSRSGLRTLAVNVWSNESSVTLAPLFFAILFLYSVIKFILLEVKRVN